MATRGINKVMLIGHLGQEPEVRQMAQGGAVTTISLATSESWRDRQTGQQQERTEWHRVVFIGKIGEIAGQYLKQGRTWRPCFFTNSPNRPRSSQPFVDPGILIGFVKPVKVG
ncbi:hypothetical protein NUITMVA2_19450 [Aeromonas caviae]|jgi:hypothetical protein|uniref:Single-stranded DNA-binding protein n=2 Tax=Aeromonas caviae TaxID=648 RepID=A0AAV4YJ91_AERCA|nr:single-stranded DNA-binding protein [Aeromonas caviae]QJT27431.1 single-stranded DNA-binding protein [Aeromonas media]MBL0584054.1 single-stranded DNA-binding protein [Aeromonas caviae]MXQ69993.1 single-stranded DNA-binding protein [Aeromonas caviae]USP60747.1 single-stranded DNA-binding protein [Aeromonas caviae]